MAQRSDFAKSKLNALEAGTKREYFRDAKERVLGHDVTPGGCKSILALLTVNGETVRLSIGKFPTLWILLTGQMTAGISQELAAKGVNPLERKRRQRAAEMAVNTVLDHCIAFRELRPSAVSDYRRAMRESFFDWLTSRWPTSPRSP